MSHPTANAGASYANATSTWGNTSSGTSFTRLTSNVTISFGATAAAGADGTLVALTDRHDQHNVYLFDTASGAGRSQPGDTNRIFDICFSATSGDNTFATAGVKHIKFWDS